MLRQVLEKLILNTFQSTPNQDVGLLTARRLHPSSTSGLEDGRNVPFQLSGVYWSWPTETCRDGLWGEAVEDQGWTGRHRESGWHGRLRVRMSNSSNYVPKPVQVVQNHHHHHHHRLPKINVVILIRWRSAILPPTPETQIEIDLDTRFSFFQIAQTQIRSICQVLERYARRFNRTWGISVSWGAKWKNNPLRQVGELCISVTYYYFYWLHLFSSWFLEWIRRRTEDGLATIKRIGIDATFKVLDSISIRILEKLFFFRWHLRITSSF